VLTTAPEEQAELRAAVMSVTAIASFIGAPEITLPVGTVAGAPVGLSLTAAPGRDRALLAFAREAAAALNLPI
jgi:amidase